MSYLIDLYFALITAALKHELLNVIIRFPGIIWDDQKSILSFNKRTFEHLYKESHDQFILLGI